LFFGILRAEYFERGFVAVVTIRTAVTVVASDSSGSKDSSGSSDNKDISDSIGSSGK